MSKSLKITTTTHAMVLAIYAASAAQGWWFATDLAGDAGLNELLTVRLGETGRVSFGIVLLIAGMVAVGAALVAPFIRLPIAPLTVEAIAVGLTAGLNGFCWFALHAVSPTYAVSTQTYAVAFALGGAARFVQIIREVLKLRRGRIDPQPASPAPLADPARG